MPLRTLYPLPRLPGFSTSRSVGSLAAIRPNNLRRVVARPVIDDDDFGIPSLRVHVGQHFLEGRAQARALVVGRNHDAVRGIQKQFSVLSSQFSVGGTEVPRAGSRGTVIVRCGFRISEVGGGPNTSGAKARADFHDSYAALEGPLFHGCAGIQVVHTRVKSKSEE